MHLPQEKGLDVERSLSIIPYPTLGARGPYKCWQARITFVVSHHIHHQLPAATTHGVSCLCQLLQRGLCTPHFSNFILPTIPDVGVVFPFPDVAIKAFESFGNLLSKYGAGLRSGPRSGSTHQKSRTHGPTPLTP